MEVDLNSIFGIDGEGLIKIPAAIGKYLTYVLILHIVGKSKPVSLSYSAYDLSNLIHDCYIVDQQPSSRASPLSCSA